MASFTDVTLQPKQWTNITTEVGVDAGVGLILQNKSAGRLLVEESVNQPASNDVGYQVNSYGHIYDTVVSAPSPTESIWVYTMTDDESVTIHVEQSS